MRNDEFTREEVEIVGKLTLWIFLLLVTLVIFWKSFATVPPGHVGVKTTFGRVHDTVLLEGFNWKAPWVKVRRFTTQETKAEQENIKIPTGDQLINEADVSVIFKMDGAQAPNLTRTVGHQKEIFEKIIYPRIRSGIRERVKSIKDAQMLFDPQIHAVLELETAERIQRDLLPYGITIIRVLVRDIQLPEQIKAAVEAKKVKAQEVERQQQELERVELQQKELVTKKKAELAAARLEAEAIRVLADAQAYQNNKLADSLTPDVLRLRWIDKWGGDLPTHALADNIEILLGAASEQ